MVAMMTRTMAIDIMPLAALGDCRCTGLFTKAATTPAADHLCLCPRFGAPQLIWGPVTDRFRRAPLFGLVGYIAMSLLCVFMHDWGCSPRASCKRLFPALEVGSAVVRDISQAAPGQLHVTGDDHLHDRANHAPHSAS